MNIKFLYTLNPKLFLLTCMVMMLVQPAFITAESNNVQALPGKNTRLIDNRAKPQKVDQFLTLIQKEKSLEGIQQAFNRSKFSKADTLAIKRKIDSSPTLKKKLDSLYRQAEAKARSESKKLDSQLKKQMAVTASQVNNKQRTLHQKSFAKMRQRAETEIRQGTVAHTNPLDPEERCKDSTPTINAVSDVMPGVQFGILGKGLGKDSGTVDIWAGGRKYPALIIKWNSCSVYAQISQDITGVLPDAQASVELKTRVGKEARAFTKFTPIIETQYFSEYKYTFGYFSGASNDYVFWNRPLKNNWYVTFSRLRHSGNGHAEITQAPPVNAVNAWTTTRVHQGVAAFAGSAFTISMGIAGPKGTPSY